MITIDHLRLHLPFEYRARAHMISRLVAEELSHVNIFSNRKIDSLNIPPVRITDGMADVQVARQVSKAVEKRLNNR